jgi:hypothetical protein
LRRILHVSVIDHPTAEWTPQQFRDFVDGQAGHRYVVHDRDTIFSAKVDKALSGFGLNVLKDSCSYNGERALRTSNRDDSPRVFGLPDPDE